LHPSVYLVFDEYFNVLLDSKDLTYRKDIEQWRSKILSASADEFWHDDEVRDIERPESIRILVCGNVGVGKSTLINKVFGVKVVSSSRRTNYIVPADENERQKAMTEKEEFTILRHRSQLRIVLIC